MKTLFCLLLSLFSFPLFAGPIVSGSVIFNSQGKPGFVKIKGEGGVPTGNLIVSDGKVSGTISVQLDKFTTGIDLRDEHMRGKYLETSKYPKAVLVLNPTPFVPGKEFKWTGKLTIKKETKDVSGVATWEKNGELEAEFTILMEDFKGIGVPSWLGITVAGDVEIEVNARAAQ